MSSKIEQVIDEIEEYLDGCKFVPFSSTNISVDKEEIEGIIDALRKQTPEEIKQLRKIISNKDAIMNDAKSKAEELYDRLNALKKYERVCINEIV